MKHTSTSLEETKKIAADFISHITEASKSNSTAATIVGLYGNLGAGKTTFTQAVAEILGVKETVTSPTFILEKIYKLENNYFSHLIHIDAYRLEREEELVHLGWKEISENPKNLIFIEWPERVKGVLNGSIIKIRFEVVGENSREIEL